VVHDVLMSRTSHVRIPPPPGTERLVEHAWVMRADGGEPWRALLVPNGRPSVVVCLGEPGERIEPLSGSRSPNAGSVAGVRRLPVVLEQRGEAWYVGVRLRAYGLALLGLRDRLVPLNTTERAPETACGSMSSGARWMSAHCSR